MHKQERGWNETPNAGQFYTTCEQKKGDQFLTIFFEEYFIILASNMSEQTRIRLLCLLEQYLKTHRNTVQW
jgi:hypothetical protein